MRGYLLGWEAALFLPMTQYNSMGKGGGVSGRSGNRPRLAIAKIFIHTPTPGESFLTPRRAMRGCLRQGPEPQPGTPELCVPAYAAWQRGLRPGKVSEVGGSLATQ